MLQVWPLKKAKKKKKDTKQNIYYLRHFLWGSAVWFWLQSQEAVIRVLVGPQSSEGWTGAGGSTWWASSCWLLAGNPYHVGFSKGGLECPQDPAASLPQSE